MPLDKIREAVTNTAKNEAELVVNAAKMAAHEHLKAARESAEREAEREYAAAVRAIDEEYARQMLQFKGGIGKELLEKRNGLLTRIFDVAKQQVLAWSAQEYGAAMRKRLERAAGGDGGRVRIHPMDKPAFAQMLAAFNEGRGADARVTIDDTSSLPTRGGFVFVGGSFEVDQTLESVLSEIEHEMAPAIAAEVFKG